MPRELQRIIDSLLEDILFTNYYIDDNLLVLKLSLDEHKPIDRKYLTISRTKLSADKLEN